MYGKRGTHGSSAGMQWLIGPAWMLLLDFEVMQVYYRFAIQLSVVELQYTARSAPVSLGVSQLRLDKPQSYCNADAESLVTSLRSLSS
jgi:hypothetical protein